MQVSYKYQFLQVQIENEKYFFTCRGVQLGQFLFSQLDQNPGCRDQFCFFHSQLPLLPQCEPQLMGDAQTRVCGADEIRLEYKNGTKCQIFSNSNILQNLCSVFLTFTNYIVQAPLFLVDQAQALYTNTIDTTDFSLTWSKFSKSGNQVIVQVRV